MPPDGGADAEDECDGNGDRQDCDDRTRASLHLPLGGWGGHAQTIWQGMFHLPRAASTFPVSRPLPPDSTLERMPLNVKSRSRSFVLAISALLVIEAGCGPQIVTTNVPAPAPSTESQRDTSKRLPPPPPPPTTIPQPVAPAVASAAERMARHATVRLVADTTTVTKHERQMLPLLVAAAREMHGIFWEQPIGPRDSVLSTTTEPSQRT